MAPCWLEADRMGRKLLFMLHLRGLQLPPLLSFSTGSAAGLIGSHGVPVCFEVIGLDSQYHLTRSSFSVTQIPRLYGAVLFHRLFPSSHAA